MRDDRSQVINTAGWLGASRAQLRQTRMGTEERRGDNPEHLHRLPAPVSVTHFMWVRIGGLRPQTSSRSLLQLVRCADQGDRRGCGKLSLTLSPDQEIRATGPHTARLGSGVSAKTHELRGNYH